jgi:hypothetical protein
MNKTILKQFSTDSFTVELHCFTWCKVCQIRVIGGDIQGGVIEFGSEYRLNETRALGIMGYIKSFCDQRPIVRSTALLYLLREQLTRRT